VSLRHQKLARLRKLAAIQLVRNGSKAGFSIKVTLPDEAEVITIERATACVEREMRRRYRLAD
jgi:hypothetical protein